MPRPRHAAEQGTRKAPQQGAFLVPVDVIFSNRVLEDLERLWALRFLIPDPCNPNADNAEEGEIKR